MIGSAKHASVSNDRKIRSGRMGYAKSAIQPFREITKGIDLLPGTGTAQLR
jgi:hypothetical protein